MLVRICFRPPPPRFVNAREKIVQLALETGEMCFQRLSSLLAPNAKPTLAEPLIMQQISKIIKERLTRSAEQERWIGL